MAEHIPNSFSLTNSAQAVSQIILARRARARVFRPQLFSDPGWDILLSLFLARLRQQRTTLGQLSRDIALSPSLTSRWIDTLHQHELVRLRSDFSDSKSIFVELSEQGTEAMQEWLEATRHIETRNDNSVIDLLSRIRDDRD